MKIIIATHNKHKVIEFKRILEPMGFEVLSQTEANIDVDIVEDGKTFYENSFKKAEAVKNTVCGEITEKCPASILRRKENAILYCDSDSSSLIREV